MFLYRLCTGTHSPRARAGGTDCITQAKLVGHGFEVWNLSVGFFERLRGHMLTLS
jgi:hypothetical protein